MSFRRSVPIYLLILLLLAACDAGSGDGGGEAEIPDTVSVRFRQVSVSPEGRVEVTADRVEVYDESDRSRFYAAAMQETDPEGELVLEGGADLIEMQGSGDGSASGNIRIDDYSGDSYLEAQELNWNSSDRLLTGTGTVTITSDSGLSITGRGFVADMARERYTFTDGVDGTLELDDED